MVSSQLFSMFSQYRTPRFIRSLLPIFLILLPLVASRRTRSSVRGRSNHARFLVDVYNYLDEKLSRPLHSQTVKSDSSEIGSYFPMLWWENNVRVSCILYTVPYHLEARLRESTRVSGTKSQQGSKEFPRVRKH